MYSKILHPTDFSPESLPALEAAHDLAAGVGAQLIVCFLANPPLAARGDTLTDPGTGVTRDIAAELETLHPAVRSVERDLQILITEKSTGIKKLLKFLEEMGADLLVLGMHRRTGIAGWWGTSITEEVVRNSHCDVLVAKRHDAQKESAEQDHGLIDEDSSSP